ncbi:MAG: Nif3-like dinuclear metal center hexameric protein [Planctomycetes bacterium RBG_13_63_9]|nr:MAG: Nif3-like dinuclear metal center hexameric protein [Planctomycetes bacterium RBG_13_63_9]
MVTVETVAALLGQLAPLGLAEDWDNVGLLVGDRGRSVERIMTCLSVTPTSTAEAIEREADLIVTHHPLPFGPVRNLTTDTTAGRLLLELMAARIAVYSPHTALDSAREGINYQLAAGLGLRGILPLVGKQALLGAGRWGWLEESLTLDQLAARAKAFLAIDRLRKVGGRAEPVRRVAVACGAAGEFVDAARDAGCDCIVTGETGFHTCLEAEACGMGLLLTGHFASERFGVEWLADVLSQRFPELGIWASAEERDPIRWV